MKLPWPIVLLSFVLPACSECREERAGAPSSKEAIGRSWKTPPLEVDANSSLPAQKLPRALHRGGSFLRNPKVVTLTFAGDDPALVARLEKFGDTITTTAWWRAVVDSYCTKPTDCIGEGSGGAHVHLDDALPAAMRDGDVDDVIERAVKAGKLDLSGRDPLLLVYLPASVTLTDAYVPKYCDGPRAFHRSLAIGERKIAYAVLPRCGDEATLTATASHELLEATANPDPSARGFAFEAGSAYLGFTAAGLEPVDPCGLITRDKHRATESGFVVQRAWSNRQAALGHDPCVPAPADQPYLALVPARPTVRLEKAGESTTIPLDAFADRAVPGWSVSAVDVTGEQDHTEYVEATVDKTRIENGQTANLRITLRKKSANGLVIVGLVSTLETTTHMWPVAVVTR